MADEDMFVIHYDASDGRKLKMISNPKIMILDICTLIDYGYEIVGIGRIK
jgi:hypothetical protein